MSEAREVKAVVFDVGRVIVQWDIRRLYAMLIADPEKLDWFCSEVVTEQWHFQADAGRDVWEMVAERQREFPGHDDLIAAYASRFLDTIPGRVPGTAALVEALHACGIPLFAITNFAGPFWREYRASEPLFDLLSDIVVSGDEKVVKPDPRICRIAAARFGHAPSEMLFIDDNRANIDAAEALGWQVHHFRDAAALAEDLRTRALI